MLSSLEESWMFYALDLTCAVFLLFDSSKPKHVVSLLRNSQRTPVTQDGRTNKVRRGKQSASSLKTSESSIREVRPRTKWHLWFFRYLSKNFEVLAILDKIFCFTRFKSRCVGFTASAILLVWTSHFGSANCGEKVQTPCLSIWS